MDRRKFLQIGALNIFTHPHSPDMYSRLLKKAVRERVYATYHGNKCGLLGTMVTDKRWGCTRGDIHCFTTININAPWLDIARREEADVDKVRAAVRLPPNLKPEFSPVPYIFLPAHHRFFFDAAALPPASARRLLEKILNSRRVRDPVQEPVDVVIEQDQEELQRIYAIPDLRSLEIEINRPNPDDMGGYEAEVQARLRAQHAHRQRTTLTAEKGQALKPDNETKLLAQVALSNGRVVATGRDSEDIMIKQSTDKHPFTVKEQFDPEVQTPFEAMYSIAKKMMAKIKPRNKQ